VSGDVIEREGKCSEERGGDADGIHAKAAGADKAYGQRATDDGQCDGCGSAEGWPLRAARCGVEQHPDRRGVLQDDGGRDVRPLDGQVVEIVRGGDTENSKQEKPQQVAAGNAQSGRASSCQEHREKHGQR